MPWAAYLLPRLRCRYDAVARIARDETLVGGGGCAWCAVAVETVAMAVRPFVRDAKQDLRVDAVPTWSERTVMLRRDCRALGNWATAEEGPETSNEGSFHSSESLGRDGGPPMMPPSR